MPFSLFPGPYVPLQPQPQQPLQQQNAVKGIITPANRPQTPSPPFQHPLATTPPQPLPQNKQKVKLVALKWVIEQLPLTRNAAPAHAVGKPSNNATVINIDISSLAEEKLVDMDASSSKTISPMEPIVLSALTNHVVSR